MAKMGRPEKIISREVFEGLCEIQCTEVEMCSVFDCCEDTLNSWCKKNYGLTFADTFKKLRPRGFVSLRRAQFKTAQEGNVTMQIWLGKQYLDQKDKQEVEQNHNHTVSQQDMALLSEYVKKEKK